MVCRYGDSLEYEKEITELLIIKHNIVWYRYPQNPLHKDTLNYCNGYNEIMEAKIAKEKGATFFDNIKAEAKELHLSRKNKTPEKNDSLGSQTQKPEA